jgi:hypothetical protein
MPFGFKIDELTEILASDSVRDRLARYADTHGRPLRLILAPEPPIDPVGAPGPTAEFLASYVAIGATGFSLRFDHHSLTHYCEQMEAMTEVAASLQLTA